MPIDKLQGTFFEAEAFAKEKGGRAGGRARVGLPQSLVSRFGILYTVQQRLASGLLKPMSDFQNIYARARASNLSATFCSNELRAMQLRTSASFKGRFINTYWTDPWTFFEFIDAAEEEQQQMLDRLFAPGCNSCKGLFLVRLAERLQAPPQLSVAEQIAIVIERCLSCAEDPLIISMYPVGLLHSASRHSCQS